jgi:hypothetical protein
MHKRRVSNPSPINLKMRIGLLTTFENYFRFANRFGPQRTLHRAPPPMSCEEGDA